MPFMGDWASNNMVTRHVLFRRWSKNIHDEISQKPARSRRVLPGLSIVSGARAASLRSVDESTGPFRLHHHFPLPSFVASESCKGQDAWGELQGGAHCRTPCGKAPSSVAWLQRARLRFTRFATPTEETPSVAPIRQLDPTTTAHLTALLVGGNVHSHSQGSQSQSS